MKNFDNKMMLKGLFSISAVVTSMLVTNIAFAASVLPTPLLHNDEGNAIVEAQHIDATVPHYEYEEELERGELTRKIEKEINELTDVEEHILKQKLEKPNYSGVDISNRTNFLSNDDKDSTDYQIDVLNGTDNFYYMQQLPPSVNPGDPLFNQFDFTTGLIEFEFELEGWTTEDPANSTYEVRIMMDEVFGVDSANNLFLDTLGHDIGLLGNISFGDKDSYGRYNFEFEFEQYDDFIDGNDIFISSEIYQAIADGILGINIVRTRGKGNLFLSESELELEKPSVVPAPPAFILFSSALLFFWGSKKTVKTAT